MWSEHKIKALFTLFHAIAQSIQPLLKFAQFPSLQKSTLKKKLLSRKLVETKFKLWLKITALSAHILSDITSPTMF